MIQRVGQPASSTPTETNEAVLSEMAIYRQPTSLSLLLRSIVVVGNDIAKMYEGLFSRDINMHRGRLRAPSGFYECISNGVRQFWMDEWVITIPQCLEVLKQSTVRPSLLLWIRYDIGPS